MRVLVASVLLVSALIPFVPPALAATHTLTASNFAWTPNDLTIVPGDSVDIVLGSGTHNWVRDGGSDSCALPCTRTFNVEETVAYHCGVHPSMTGTIRVAAPEAAPRVTITSPGPGATLSGSVTVTGTASAGSDIQSVTIRVDGGPPISAQLSGPANDVSWSASLPTTSLADGDHTLTARAVTVTGLSAETSISITIDNPVILDVVLATASAQPGAVTTNTISFTVRNDGNVPASNVLVRAEYFYHGTWRPIGERTIDSIGLGTTVSSSIAWTPPSRQIGAFDVRVTVDPHAALPDPDRANNVRAVRAGWITSAVPGIILTEP